MKNKTLEERTQKCIWKHIRNIEVIKVERYCKAYSIEFNPFSVMKQCSDCEGYSKTCSLYDFMDIKRMLENAELNGNIRNT